MSDDVKHSDDELFTATEANDRSMDDVSSTSDSTGGDENTNGLNLSTDAETTKQQQVDAWLRKVESGEATLDELNGKQKWLVPLVQEKLAAKEGARKQLDKEAMSQLIREEVLKAKQEVRIDDEFNSLKKELSSVSLTSDQQKLIQTKFDSLKGRLDKAEALKIAVELAHVTFDTPAPLPRFKVGNGVKEESGISENTDVNKLSQEDRMKQVQRLRAR
jgi:hypothetical protein